MEWIIISLLVAIAVGSTVIGLSRQGRGAFRITVDGVTLQLPQWAYIQALQDLTLPEQATVAEVGQAEQAMRRAEQAMQRGKRADRATRREAQEDLDQARQSYQRTQQDAQIAVTNAIRRWLLSDDGQDWLHANQLRFPPTT